MNSRFFINIFFLVFFIFFPFSNFAQEKNTLVENKFALNDFSAEIGIIPESPVIGTLDDFKMLAPNSEILKKDFTDWSAILGYYSTIPRKTPFNMFNVRVGIAPFKNSMNRAFRNSILKPGFSYFSGTEVTGYFEKVYSRPFDTLVSLQTGKNTYIDSVFKHWMNVNYYSEQLHFDASFVLSTGDEGNFSIHSGIGLSGGWELNSYTRIDTGFSKNTEARNGNSYNDYYFGITGSGSEKKINKNGSSFYMYVPMSLYFRFSKEHEFWKRIFLFYEMKGGLYFLVIPELRTYKRGIIRHGAGIRIVVG